MKNTFTTPGGNRCRRVGLKIFMTLTQGKICTLDSSDLDLVDKRRWCASKMRDKWYALTSVKREGQSTTTTLMHILILPGSPQVDHKDGNGLNNRFNNLRPANHSTNQMNTLKQSNNTSGYKGVHWDKRRSRWVPQICVNGRKPYLGYFTNPEDAAKAYIEAAKRLHGEFAKFEEIPCK